MITDGADPMISVFFVAGGLLMLILAIAYLIPKIKAFRLFGIGIILDAIAFEIWAYMSIARPDNLEVITNIGILFFFASFIMYSLVVLSTLKGRFRIFVSIFTAILFAALLVMRFIFVKSNPHFLDSGLFSWGIEPQVMYIYVVISSFTILPAAYIVAGKFKNAAARNLIQFGFTLIVIGITVLLTSDNRELQTFNGYGMIAGLLLATVSQVATVAPMIASGKKIK